MNAGLLLFFLARTIHIPIIPVKKITSEPLRDDKLTSFACLTGLKKNCQVSLFAQQGKKQILFLFLCLEFRLAIFFFMKTSDFLGRSQKIKEKQKNNLRLRETCG